MKKLAIVAGALIALLIVAIATLPLFVNVDKYRPQIVSAVNQRIDGTLELGHLSLSLWGQVRIEIAGLSLKDAQGTNVVSVRSAYFHLPLLPLLSGSPVLELNMDSPVVNVVKSRAGKLNLALLMKSAVPESSNPGTSASAPGTSGAGGGSSTSVAVPAIAANARLGLNLHDATIAYADDTKGLTTELKDLNILAQDLSLTHPSTIAIWSDFDTRLGKSLSIKGPGRLDLQFSPHIGTEKMIEFALRGKADFDGLEISMPGTFEKKSGVPANLEIAASGMLGGQTQELKIEKADLRFFNAVVQSSGSITGSAENPTLHYTVRSNSIDLQPWTELLPMLSQYQLGGHANLTAEIGGESSKLSYQAKLALSDVTARAPMLKSQPRINGEVDIATDQVRNLELTLSAPGNNLTISGKVLSFTAPQASFDVTSPGMDLDQLIDFKAIQAKKSESASSGLVSAAFAQAAERPATDLDVMLDPVRENKVLAKTTASVKIDVRSLQAENIKMTDLAGKLYFKDLGAGLEGFALKVFGGTVKANLACELRPEQPTYKFSANVQDLDLAQAVQSQMAMFKNTATGTANFELTGEGASFNPDVAKARLKAKGTLKITNAQLSTIDVGKMAADGIRNALSKVAGRIPGLANRSINPPVRASKYQLISSDFGISAGRFSAPNLTAKAAPRQGIDFKGSAQVGLKNQSLDAKVQVIDTYDLLGARELQNGVLCERGKPFILPVSVGCTLQSPCYSYQDSAEYLVKVAMNNMVGHVRNQVQSQVRSQVVNQIKNALGGHGGGTPNLGNALKGLFGN